MMLYCCHDDDSQRIKNQDNKLVHHSLHCLYHVSDLLLGFFPSF